MRSHRMPVKKVVVKIKRATYGSREDWSALSLSIRERDNFTCTRCGRHKSVLRPGERLEAHHITPISKGGTNSRINLRTLCSLCHSKMPGHSHLRGR